MNVNKKTRIAKIIVKYTIEIVIVAFGVFLGVYFSNINTDHKTKTEKEKSLNLIIKELEHNKQLIENYISYHKNIKVQIDSIHKNLDEENKYISLAKTKDFNHNTIKGWNGFQYARLQNTAFESSKISGILKEFDIEVIQKISNAYTLQETYTDFGSSILKKAIETDSSTKVIDFVGIIILMTSDLLSLEKALDTALNKIITDLETL